MTERELLNIIESKITLDIRQQFEFEYLNDRKRISYLNLIWSYGKYKDIKGEWNPEEYNENFIEEIEKEGFIKDYKDLNEDELTRALDSALYNLYRYTQLIKHGPFISYEDKLKFIANEEPDNFNYLRTYIIPGLEDFSVFPKDHTEIDTYINYLSDYLTPSGDYRLLYDSNNKTIDYFIEEFVNQLSIDNYAHLISHYINNFEKIYPVNKFQEVYSISIEFYKNLKKYGLDLNKFLYHTSDPLIFFIVLFPRRKSQPIGEFKYYLEIFDWDHDKDRVLYLKSDNLEFIPKGGYESKSFIPNNDGKYFVQYSNFEQKTVYEKLFTDKIRKSEFRLLYYFYKNLHPEIFNISNSNSTLIEDKLREISSVVNALEDFDKQFQFLNSIIPFFSNYEINQINPLVWLAFTEKITSLKDDFLKTNEQKVLPNAKRITNPEFELGNKSRLGEENSLSTDEKMIVFFNAHPAPQINNARLNDEELRSKTNQICIYLEKYYNYKSSGDLAVDLEYLYSLGFDDSNCSSKGSYCPGCIYSFLRYKTQLDLIRKNLPFSSYRHKLEFIIKNDNLFEALSISIMIDDNRFTTYPANEEESDIYIPIAWEIKENENKEKRLSGQKLIQNKFPIVSFNELKCTLYLKSLKSRDVKLLLKNEYDRILNLFPKVNKLGIESVFWYIHDLMVNSEKHVYDSNDNHKSVGYVEYGPLATHYVNYYFYLNNIIENRQDIFLESIKYVESDFICFHVTSHPALSQSEIDEISYSGKYIVEISRPEPIPYIYNIINSNKVLHTNFQDIIDFFMDTKLWEFPIIKPEIEINADGRKIRSRSENTSNPREHAKSVISFADNLPDIRESLLTEYVNLISDVNKHTASISSLISIIKMNIPNKSKMSKEEKKKKKRNILEMFIYMIDIHSDRGKNISIFETNPFDYYFDIISYFRGAKNYISSELRKIPISFDRELFLDELLSTIKQIATSENSDLPDADDYLKPYNLTFEQLMESTDKRIPIVYEIGLSQELINYNYQDTTVKTEKFAQKATFVRLVPFHFKTKMIEYITGLKEKLEKDTNLKLHSNSTTSPSIVKETNNINYESYEFFKKWFEYPLEHSPLGYYHQWQENLKYLKTEIEDNLLNLDTTKSNIYLSKLTRELLDILKTSNTTVEELNIWYDKYNTSEEDLVKYYDYKNTLHKILNNEPINDRNAFDDDHHTDTDKLQWSFYDYHYGQIIKAALAHINNSILLLNPNKVNSSPILQSDDQLLPVSEFYSSNQSSPINDSKINPLIKRFLFSLTSKNWKEKVSHFDNEINSNSFPDFSQDIIQEFQNYLLNFNWDNNLPEVTEIQWKGITLINPENDGKSLYGYDPFYHDEPYNIFYRSVKEYNFYKQILVKPILLQDLDLVRKLLKAIIKKLNVKTAFIGSQGNDFINNINKKTNEFISSGLKERFNLNLLDYFDIDLIEYPDVQEMYRQFKKLWIERFAEIYSNNNTSEGTPELYPTLIINKSNQNHITKNDHDKELKLSDVDQVTIIAAFDYLKITENGVYVLTEKKKSSIRAVLDTLISNSKITDLPIKKLCFYVSNLINADLKSLPEKGNTYDDYEKKTNEYLKNLKQ